MSGFMVNRVRPGSGASRGARRRAAVVLAAIGLSVIGAAGTSGRAVASSERPSGRRAANGTTGSLRSVGAAPAGSEKVAIGLYAVHLLELEESANTYFLSGYLWLRWSGPIDPTTSIEFVNAVADFTRTPLTPAPEALPGGQKLQRYKIEGRFFHAFDVVHYPFDKQGMQILVESTRVTSPKLFLVPDTAHLGVDPEVHLPGWAVKGMTAESLVHTYGTGFGRGTGAATTRNPGVSFSLEIDRDRSIFFWKLLFPLLLVLAINWFSLLVHPSEAGARLAMPATALLTAVFLQQTTLEGLPHVSSLVLMDEIYVAAYVAIVLTFLWVMWDHFRVVVDDEASVSRVRRLDRLGVIGQLVVFVVAVLALVLPQI